jgi:hypothetical protein
MAVAPLSPLTGAGEANAGLALTSSPQHWTVPPAISAHAWAKAELTATAFVIRETGPGVEVLVVVPLPSWASKFTPQQSTPPEVSTAHVKGPKVDRVEDP